MINTSRLREGDLVKVWIEGGIGGELTTAECKFSNGIFVNIEQTIHRNEIYGSSVVRFKKKCQYANPNISPWDYCMHEQLNPTHKAGIFCDKAKCPMVHRKYKKKGGK